MKSLKSIIRPSHFPLNNNMTMRYLILLLSLASSNAFGQNYTDLINMGMSYIEPATFQNISTNEMRQEHAWLDAGFAFPLNAKGDELSLGFGYQYQGWSNADQPSLPLEISTTGLSVDWLKNWKNPRWASTLSVGGAFSSDGNSSANSAFQTAFSYLMHFGNSSDAIWTFGVFYSDQPFGPWAFPILGLEWQLHDRVHVSTVLFNHVNVEIEAVSDRLFVGLDHRAFGTSFVLGEYLGFQNSYITSFSEQFPFYPYFGSVFTDFHLTPHLVFTGKIGVLHGRQQIHHTANHEFIVSSPYNDAINSSLMAQFGLAWRYRTR